MPQSWIIDCRKMYKISDSVRKFTTEAMKNWKVELITKVKPLTEMKIQRGIFQADVLSPLQFIIPMIPLKYIFRKSTWGYEFTKSQEKINHQMYIVDIKLFAKKDKKLETDTNNENMQSGNRNGIWHRKMWPAHNEK